MPGNLFAGEAKERMVLLPIEGEHLSDGDKALFQNAIRKAFQTGTRFSAVSRWRPNSRNSP